MLYAADIGQQFADLLGTVVGIAIKVLIFLIIIGLGWFVASWLRRWITKGLQRVGFDRAVERGGLHRLLGGNSASDLTARLVMFAFLLFVLQLAFGIFGPNPVSDPDRRRHRLAAQAVRGGRHRGRHRGHRRLGQGPDQPEAWAG